MGKAQFNQYRLVLMKSSIRNNKIGNMYHLLYQGKSKRSIPKKLIRILTKGCPEKEILLCMYFYYYHTFSTLADISQRITENSKKRFGYFG